MMPLTLSNSMLSESIRKKKKKMATSEPEMVGTSPMSDLDAQDIYDIEKDARIESTLMSPEKINADLTDIDAEEEYDGVGISPKEKMRMERLRKYMDTLDLWD